MQPIEICAWCPEWPTQFAVKAKLIRSVLDARAMRIDHIGSTAIRGLAAKPIIDIQISVADLQSVEVLRERMTAIGYVWRPSNADLTKRYFREAPGNERTHVHVRGRGSWSEQWSLLFRDYMRAHAQEHAPYAELKRALAARYQNDRVALHRGQVRTLWTIIHRADRWAAQTGWRRARPTLDRTRHSEREHSAASAR